MRSSVLIALLAGLAAFAPSAAAARPPSVLTQEHPVFQVRPGVISYTGDGTGIVGGLDGTGVRHLGRLHWTTYSDREGVATGKLWLDDCTPDCAQGTYSATRVQVHVFSPSHGRFRRLALRYEYKGKRYDDRRVIHFYAGFNGSRGYWAYAIVS
jgi:hypothetical protein